MVSGNAVRSAFGIAETASRWGVSPFTVRRLIKAGKIRTINVGARRLIPATELDRVELMGVGQARKVGK